MKTMDPKNNLAKRTTQRATQNPHIMKPYCLVAENASGDTSRNNGNLSRLISEAELESISEQDLRSLNINDDTACTAVNGRCILLLDDQERLLIQSDEQLFAALHIDNNVHGVKVVSIFGNTGEGKSHTLNHVFFDGAEVFPTSAEQTSCTLGVWAAYDPQLNVIILDTEGLLGVTRKENQRTRLLLKVLAISDVVLYRTRAERLQRDMYTFLGGASRAFRDHFQAALQQVWQAFEMDAQSTPPSVSALGPSCIIFHETRHTRTLQCSANVIESPEDILRRQFAELQLECDAFSSLRYVGVQTRDANATTSFRELRNAVHLDLENNTVRSKRKPKVIFQTLKGLNDKFSGEIRNVPAQLYLKEYFTCQVRCQSCNEGCYLSMGHKEEGKPHASKHECRFQHQFQNCVSLCKQCFKGGQRVIVKPSYHSVAENSWSNLLNYVWSGYIIECRNCGEIFRSRQHWYGNKNPEEAAVIPEIVHIWPGERNYIGSNNSAQRVIDGVNMITDYVSSVSSQSTKQVASWAMDKIAPDYWRPNNEITECHKCKEIFSSAATKHHCRACGEGFCEKCSLKSQPVPARGWLEDVRVCDLCYREEPVSLSSAQDDADIRVRKYGEAVASSLSAVASVLELPRSLIKDTARPSYWTPDAECLNCACCRKALGILLPLHHCRDCGQGVCDDCSQTKKPVPQRGWNYPVRVCDNCLRK